MLSQERLDALRMVKESISDLDRVHVKDKPVGLVVACWPNITLDYLKDATPCPDNPTHVLAWIWEPVQFNLMELAWLTGLRERTPFAFERAKRNRLIYPDGTVDEKAGREVVKQAFFWGMNQT